MSVTFSEFGHTDAGTASLFTCVNKNGLVLKMTNLGATIVSLEVPDRDGSKDSVMLGFDSPGEYLEHDAYFGATIGRFGNRIAEGKFTLDGAQYTLATNNGPNHLHGGGTGYDSVLWKAEPIETDDEIGIRFEYTSPDGEEGYPGNLGIIVTYTLTNNDELRIVYDAETDAPTVINLTNHAYWNLAGAKSGSILEHLLQIESDSVLAVDDGLIPTGEFSSVHGTEMDFTMPRVIGERIDVLKEIENGPGGYDHCYVLRNQAGEMALAATLCDPTSGRKMEVHTDLPGIQFYSGNFLDAENAANGNNPQHGALCLETQRYPDSPNQPDFPSTVLRPGEKYHTETVYKFSVE